MKPFIVEEMHAVTTNSSTYTNPPPPPQNNTTTTSPQNIHRPGGHTRKQNYQHLTTAALHVD